MIDELDLVVLKRDLPKERLAIGDVGTVVLVHQQNAGYEVEFTTLAGDTVAIVTLDPSDVRPVAPREIVHARAVSCRTSPKVPSSPDHCRQTCSSIRRSRP